MQILWDTYVSGKSIFTKASGEFWNRASGGKRAEEIGFRRCCYSEKKLTERDSLQKTRFPVAGIFIILHGMILLYHAAFTLGNNPGEYLFVGIAGDLFWPTLLHFFMMITISVLLYRRKINKSLAVLLALYSIWNILACMYNVPMYSKLVWYGMIPYFGGWSLINFLAYSLSPNFILFDIEILSYIALVFLAISSLQKENGFSVIEKKFWYVSGVLSCLAATVWILFPKYYTIRTFVLILCLIAENFFLGWWLAHPYKTKNIPKDRPNPVSKEVLSYNRENISSEEKLNNHLGDTPSFGYVVLGFFIPVSGLILYLIWREQTPLRAKSAGKGALFGVIVWIVLPIFIVILLFILSTSMLLFGVSQ